MEEAVLYIHIGSIAAYLVIFLTRLIMLWFKSDEDLLLFSDRTKNINYTLLGIIVLSGLYLGFTYDFSEGLWFVVKLVLLIIIAFSGDYAFRNFSKSAGVFTLIVFLYIIAISYTKSLDLVFRN